MTPALQEQWTRNGLTGEQRVVELACRAPSIHNTQPWLWRIRPASIELYADRTRQLPVTDPAGRNLLLSCGAALHHALVAAAGTGLGVEVERMPDGPEGDRLAVLRLSRAPVRPADAEQLEALETRQTDRRRFSSWPVPGERLTQLAREVSTSEVFAVPLTDAGQRFRTEALIGRAMRVQDEDPRFAGEQDDWTRVGGGGGIPVSTLIPLEVGARSWPSRFAGHEEVRPSTGGSTGRTDGLIALTTVEDDPRSWLLCGEALSGLWLLATASGLSMVPLSQVIEVDETRTALKHEVLGRPPQILARIGWQEIGRRRLPRTPRRPVDEVVLA